MIATVNITVRVEEDTKKQFEGFCDSVGLNMTSALNMFIKTVLRNRELPFVVTDVKKDNRADFKAAFKALQDESVANGTNEMTMDEIDAEIAAYRQESRGK